MVDSPSDIHYLVPIVKYCVPDSIMTLYDHVIDKQKVRDSLNDSDCCTSPIFPSCLCYGDPIVSRDIRSLCVPCRHDDVSGQRYSSLDRPQMGTDTYVYS